MHQVVYNNKLELKCNSTPLDPRLLYVGQVQTKGYLFFRGTYSDLYSYLSVLCVLCLAACGAAQYLSMLCSVGQLLTHTMQCWAAPNEHCSDFCQVYIVFVLFFDHIYQNYKVSQYIRAIGLIFLTFDH